MKKILIAVVIIAVIAALCCALFIPYATTTGVITHEFHSSGNVEINADGSTGKTEINKTITVEFTVQGTAYEASYHQKYKEDAPQYYSKFEGDTVEVCYNPIIPSINRLA